MRAARGRVLVVDDEHVMLRAWRKLMPEKRYEVVVCDNGEEALEILASRPVDAMVTDLMMPGMDGMELLRRAKAGQPELEVIVMTGYATVETAVEALKGGAYDYLTKPFEDIDEVARVVGRAVDRKRLVDRARRLEEELEARDRFGGLIGSSEPMRAVFEMAVQVAWSTTTVLIQGESGTGKELVAKGIHFKSPRKGKAFVPVNCGALTETLLESELFGHEKGAFTGAVGAKKGLFEAAHGGTIFLDEIGEVSPAMQVRLLRVLNDGEIKRVGSNEAKHVDVRVIAATNKNLTKAVKDSSFREDLYFRLNVITLQLPPLRDRPEDIPPLAYHFLKLFAEKVEKPITRIDTDVIAVLQAYKWPGNVRELENVIERAVVLQQGEAVEMRCLPDRLRGGGFERPDGDRVYAHLPYAQARQSASDSFERRYVSELLRRSEGNISQAARLAGMDRSNFRRILKKHDLENLLP